MKARWFSTILLCACHCVDSAGAAPPFLWKAKSPLAEWQQDWGIGKVGFGFRNVQALASDDIRFPYILRVTYPGGSASPAVSKTSGAAIGGVSFVAHAGISPADYICLRYYLKFPSDFDFVKGGKLPGLSGGAANRGRNIPSGEDGFSVRFMWRDGGEGEVYAYTPDSMGVGTSLARGAWKFNRGKWQCLEQELKLNTPGARDGSVRVWLDGKLVAQQQGLRFRDASALQIDAVLFSTFFGGGDASWATPENTFADFAGFAISDRHIDP
jgi:hypothetical protein